MIAQRAELGKNFGVVLIPEGLVEFMHDVSTLIAGEGSSRAGAHAGQPRHACALLCCPAGRPDAAVGQRCCVLCCALVAHPRLTCLLMRRRVPQS